MTDSQGHRGSIRRQGISVGHRDLGRLPLLGTEEWLRVAGDAVARERHTGGYACASCGRVMVHPDRFSLVCVCCGLPICTRQECQVFCAEETCRQAVCARDRRSIGTDGDGQPRYLCLPHYEEWQRGWAVVGLIAVAAVVIGILLFLWLG